MPTKHHLKKLIIITLIVIHSYTYSANSRA